MSSDPENETMADVVEQTLPAAGDALPLEPAPGSGPPEGSLLAESQATPGVMPPAKLAGPADLNLLVACPKCGTAGHLRCSQLPHAVHCGHCHNRFWVDSNGRLKSESQAERMRFQCPRCQHREYMPAVRKVRCGRCGIMCFREAGGEFLTEEESQRRKSKTSPDPATTKTAQPRSPRRETAEVGGRNWKLVAGVSLLVLMIAAALIPWRELSRPSLEQVALEFTELCAGLRRDEAAARYVRESDQEQFRRWSTIVFPDYLDPIKSAPGYIPDENQRITASVLSAEPIGEATRVRLKLHVSGQGQRLVTQFWQMHDEEWRFAAETTWAAIKANRGD